MFYTSLPAKIGLSLFSFGLFSLPAHAGPFACDSEIFQVQSGQLKQFDTVTSVYVDIGPDQANYNATGFNVQDNYGYGVLNSKVIRIHGDGTIEDVHTLGFGSYAGDVDNNNTIWLRRSASSYSAVDLTTGVIATTNFTGTTVNAADVAFIVNSGVNYLIAPSATKVGLLNLDNGSSVSKTITGLPSSGAFGASWTDFNEKMYTFHNNTGEIYELFDIFGTAPYGVKVAQGTPSGNNDGFSCNAATFPNFPPLAEDDDFTTPANVSISANVLVDNGNGVDSDPEGLVLTVVTTPITGPSNGSITLSANGDFTYVPNAGYSGTDSFVYQITDPDGLTSEATVTITIEVPSITAGDDDFSGVPIASTGGSTSSVFTDDAINSAGFADGDVIPTILKEDGLTGVTINADGTLTVPTGSTPGTYNVEYQICETAVPTNCATAISTVVIGPSVDLSITKTNTPGVNGNIDQASDTVTSGETTTYTLTVTNNGPDLVTGAVVTDTPGSGLTCLASDSVNITGDGVPAGSFIIGDLTGSGIVLSTLADGQSTTLSFPCNVD